MKKTLVLAATLAIVFLPQYIFTGPPSATNQAEVLGSVVEQVIAPELVPQVAEVLEPPVLSANSALAYDQATGNVLFSKNFEQPSSIASLTKLMTALVVVDHLSLDQVVTIAPEGAGVTGSSMGLLAYEKLTVEDLLKGLLISSSNDAAMSLALAVSGTQEEFVALMNFKAADLNMNATHFNNPIGFDDPYNYSTAHDLSLLVKEFVKHPELGEITRIPQTAVTSIDEKFSHELNTTNQLLLEDSNVIGLKTGFTSWAKGNLIVRYNQDSAEIVTIILNSDDREQDTRQLLDWILSVYKW